MITLRWWQLEAKFFGALGKSLTWKRFILIGMQETAF
jgi:hypothetical protein